MLTCRTGVDDIKGRKSNGGLGGHPLGVKGRAEELAQRPIITSTGEDSCWPPNGAVSVLSRCIGLCCGQST